MENSACCFKCIRYRSGTPGRKQEVILQLKLLTISNESVIRTVHYHSDTSVVRLRSFSPDNVIKHLQVLKTLYFVPNLNPSPYSHATACLPVRRGILFTLICPSAKVVGCPWGRWTGGPGTETGGVGWMGTCWGSVGG